MNKYLKLALIITITIGIAATSMAAQGHRKDAAPAPKATAVSKPAVSPARVAALQRFLAARKAGRAADDPCSTSVPITLSQPISASLAGGDCAVGDGTVVDFYDFHGTSGQAVWFSETSAAFDSYLYLFDDSGNIIDENDDSGNTNDSRIPIDGGVMTLPYTGEYFLAANSYNPASGSYTITADTFAACAPAAIAYNQPANGTLASADSAVNIGDQPYYTDLYTFNGKAGQQISIAMSSTDVDAYLVLHTPSGDGSVEDDDGGGDTNSRVPASGTMTLAETGLYTIEASTSNSGEVGSYTLTIIGPAAASKAAADFDGDGKSDLSLFRESEGNWYVINSTNGTLTAPHFGIPGDRIVPGDYDGDGKIDFAVWRPSSGTWFVLPSSGGFTSYQFGAPTDIPAQGDFDGDGKTDFAVFRPSSGTWFLQMSTAGFGVVPFGANGDRPVPGDYDGDGKTDVAVFRPSDGVWYLQRSRDGYIGYQFGAATDKVAPADFDGDGKTDPAVFRNGTWYILQSTAGFSPIPFGSPGDIPAAGDFDGDGKADISVFRPSTGIWFQQRSTSGFFAAQFGQNGDKPAPSGYVPLQ